jgi:hypothetical protein
LNRITDPKLRGADCILDSYRDSTSRYEQGGCISGGAWGMEYSVGWFVNFSRSSNNFDGPNYRIHQVSYGIGYYNVSGGVSQTGMLVIPTLPVFIQPPY